MVIPINAVYSPTLLLPLLTKLLMKNVGTLYSLIRENYMGRLFEDRDFLILLTPNPAPIRQKQTATSTNRVFEHAQALVAIYYILLLIYC